MIQTVLNQHLYQKFILIRRDESNNSLNISNKLSYEKKKTKIEL